MPVVERRAIVHMDLARAYTQWGKYGEAVDALRTNRPDRSPRTHPPGGKRYHPPHRHARPGHRPNSPARADSSNRMTRPVALYRRLRRWPSIRRLASLSTWPTSKPGKSRSSPPLPVCPSSISRRSKRRPVDQSAVSTGNPVNPATARRHRPSLWRPRPTTPSTNSPPGSATPTPSESYPKQSDLICPSCLCPSSTHPLQPAALHPVSRRT